MRQIVIKRQAFVHRVVDRIRDIVREVFFEIFARQLQVLLRKRLFLETMEQVLGSSEKVLVEPGTTGSGVVPYLPLPALQSGGGTTTTTPTTPSTPAGN